jgi:ATP-binding cassette subfamily C protein
MLRRQKHLDFALRETLNLIRSAISLLNPNQRKMILKFGVAQALLSLLDLVAVGLFGMLGSLAVSGIQSKAPNSTIFNALSLLRIANFDFQSQVAILALVASTLLVTRTFLSIYLSRFLLAKLAEWSATFSVSLFERLMKGPIVEIRKTSALQIIHNITTGVNTLTITVLGGSINILGDTTVVVFVMIGIFLLDPIMGVSIICIFIVLILTLYIFLHKKAEYLGRLETKLTVSSNESILKALTSFREVYVRNRAQYFIQEFQAKRSLLTRTQAKVAFMPSISKYVFELAMVVGGLFICAVQFAFHDATSAVGSLTLFFAGSSRIAPALLRLQQGFLGLNSAKGYCSETLGMLQNQPSSFDDNDATEKTELHQNFVELNQVCFSFEDSQDPTINNLNLGLPESGMFAIVGDSGAGKTTLIDLILGVLTPTSGHIRVGSLSPSNYIKANPGKVGYVPQKTNIFQGTIKDNVLLGFDEDAYSIGQIRNALEKANLLEFVESQQFGLDTAVGPGGLTLSGGQEQRLGIARALITDPSFLILDESTSSLDAQSEDAIMQTLIKLSDTCLILVIAHRLSSIKTSDSILFLENGNLAGLGTFNDLYARNEKFRKQVDLLSV